MLATLNDVVSPALPHLMPQVLTNHGAVRNRRPERSPDLLPLHAMRGHFLPKGRHLPAGNGPAEGGYRWSSRLC